MVNPHSFREQERQINRENGSGRPDGVSGHEQGRNAARHQKYSQAEADDGLHPQPNRNPARWKTRQQSERKEKRNHRMKIASQ